MNNIELKPELLHIDADRNFREAFSSMFRDKFSFHFAETPEEVFRKLKFHPVDMIILDYKIQGTEDLELLEAIKINHPDVPVIIYVEKENRSIIRDAFIKGASDYFEKNLLDSSHREKLLNSILKNIEKRKAENALKESELKYKKLFNNANDIIFLHTATSNPEECRFLEVNDIACQKLGYTREELFELSPVNFYFHEDNTSICDDMQRVLTLGNATFEIVSRCKDGQDLNFEINAHLFELNGRNVVLSIARDITERKKTETELKRSREKYKHLVEDISDVIFSLNEYGNILYISPTVKMLSGYTSEDLTGKNIRNIINPEDFDYVWDKLQTHIPGSEIELDFRIVTSTGEKKWARAMGTPIFQDGKFECVKGALREITSRKKEEENNRYLMETIEQTLEDSGIWIFMTDYKGIPIKWNEAAEKLSGYTKKEIIGNKNFWNLLYPDKEYKKKVLSKYLRKNTNGGLMLETTITSKDNKKRIVQWVSRNLVDRQGNFTGLICIGKDLTSKEMLKQGFALKCKELDDIIYMVSHDFRGPLSMINAYISEINRDPSMTALFSGKIIQQSTSLMDFIEDLLKLSRSGKPINNAIKINLDVLINKVLFSLNPADVDIRMQIETDLPIINGDFIRIEQVFKNLIQNSIKFRDHAKEQLLIKIGTIKTENGILIYIKDNGAGIKKENMDKIFNMGFKAGSNSRGLGLSIAKNIIEVHSGKIWAESAGENKGAEFYIELPNEIKKEAFSRHK